MTDVTQLKLHPLTAWDEVSFARRMARVLALVLPDVGEIRRAAARAPVPDPEGLLPYERRNHPWTLYR